jgi:hypothetical protein
MPKRGMCLEAAIIKAAEMQGIEIPWEEANDDDFITKYSLKVEPIHLSRIETFSVIYGWQKMMQPEIGYHCVVKLPDGKYWDPEDGEKKDNVGLLGIEGGYYYYYVVRTKTWKEMI